jgi:hypothetical protein
VNVGLGIRLSPYPALPLPIYEAVALRPTGSLWCGEYGTYEVPRAVEWLAEAANARVGLPPPRYTDQDTPAEKVLNEWGAWRDSCERLATYVLRPDAYTHQADGRMVSRATGKVMP